MRQTKEEKLDEFLTADDSAKRKATTLGKAIEKRLRLKISQQYYASTKVKYFPKEGWECASYGIWSLILSSKFKEYIQDTFCEIYPPTILEQKKAMQKFVYIGSLGALKESPDYYEKRFGTNIFDLEEFAKKNFDNVNNVTFFIK